MSQLETVLQNESHLLDEILCEQENLKIAVQKKTWNNLIDTIARMNDLAENFEQYENARTALEKNGFIDTKAKELRSEVQKKLLKSAITNRSLGSYLSIMREFIQGVLDHAAPTGQTMVYSRTGKIMHSSPRSVVLNTVY